MPSNTEERVANASRMVEAAYAAGIAAADVYVDPLIFPISVDDEFGSHALGAIAELLERNLRPERIPAVVRSEAEAYAGRSMLTSIADDRQDELLASVERSFDWAATA